MQGHTLQQTIYTFKYFYSKAAIFIPLSYLKIVS